MLQALGRAALVLIGLIHPPLIVHRHQYVYILLAPPPPVNHAPQRIPAELLNPPMVRHVEIQRVAKLEPSQIEVPVRKPEIPEVKQLEIF